MDWRKWLYETLTEDSAVTDLVGDRVFSTLDDAAPDERPYIVIRMDANIPDVGDLQDCVIWVYDSPGSFCGIDDVLAAVKTALVGPVGESGAICAIWQGDSADLGDDVRGTALRTASFRLVGRRSA